MLICPTAPPSRLGLLGRLGDTMSMWRGRAGGGEAHAIGAGRRAEGTGEKILDPVPVQSIAIFCAWDPLVVVRS